MGDLRILCYMIVARHSKDTLIRLKNPVPLSERPGLQKHIVCFPSEGLNYAYACITYDT